VRGTYIDVLFLLRLSCIGDVSLGRYNRTPRMRVQKAENVNKALEFITSRGVKLTNIGPEGEFLFNFWIGRGALNPLLRHY
jgi:hypothetical protein